MDIENAGKHVEDRPSYEVDGPYIDSPDWPWSAAGWLIAAMVVFLFVLADLNR